MKFKILQIMLDKNKRNPYIFMDYEYAIENGFSIDDYKEVYEDEIDTISFETLEQIYNKYNMNRPNDFKGHSLSVSDIIKFENGTTYYVDSLGFTLI